MTAGLLPLKLLLLGLWASWFALVLITNVFDAVHAMGKLPDNWVFRSQNFKRVREAVELYEAPLWLAALLFVGVMVWQAAVAILLWYTWTASLAAGQVQLAQVNFAFVGAMGMWAAFILAEEIFKQYRTETKHLLFFTAQLLTLVALHLLPG